MEDAWITDRKHIILRKAKESDYRPMLKNVWGDPYVYEWMLFEPTFIEEEAIGIMSVMSDRRALYHLTTDSTERFHYNRYSHDI